MRKIEEVELTSSLSSEVGSPVRCEGRAARLGPIMSEVVLNLLDDRPDDAVCRAVPAFDAPVAGIARRSE